MTKSIVCSNCGESFDGRSNRETCSVKCRRHLEYKRRKWDRIDNKATDLEIAAIPGPPGPWDELFDKSKREAQEKAERKGFLKTAAAIRKYNGERP